VHHIFFSQHGQPLDWERVEKIVATLLP